MNTNRLQVVPPGFRKRQARKPNGANSRLTFRDLEIGASFCSVRNDGSFSISLTKISCGSAKAKYKDEKPIPVNDSSQLVKRV